MTSFLRNVARMFDRDTWLAVVETARHDTNIRWLRLLAEEMDSDDLNGSRGQRLRQIAADYERLVGRAGEGREARRS